MFENADTVRNFFDRQLGVLRVHQKRDGEGLLLPTALREASIAVIL
jgi:hypothetical protein